MLKIVVRGRELFNDNTNEFIRLNDTTLLLEHSLLSLSKWEAKWKKSYLECKGKFTQEEFCDYLRCMTINQGVDPMIYYYISPSQRREIVDYINNPMTATTISRTAKHRGRREIVTSELIYYWMVVNNIPFECQKWHLNRLMTLIEICAIKSNPDKKMSKKEIMKQNAAINAKRMAALHGK